MDLIETLKSQISSNAVGLISQKTGESEEKTKAGLFAAVPSVLAGIMKNGSSAGTGFWGNLLSGFAGRGSSVENPEAVLQDPDPITKGKSMLTNLFGNDTNSVVGAISNSSGISVEKSSGLLAMATPLVMGHLSNIMSRQGWSFPDLLRNLFENKSAIISSLPGNLGASLGLSSLKMPDLVRKVETPGVSANIPPTRTHVPPVKANARADYRGGTSSIGAGFLKWVIPLLIILLAGWWILGKKGCNKSNMPPVVDTLGTKAGSILDTSVNAAKGAMNAAGEWVYNLGNTVHKKLPDGKEINIGENSVENRLINFIEDKNRPVDKTTWFSFDRLYFEEGKSSLKPESKEQLENIAAILKAYPQVKIKLGGYTDNTGGAEANKRLSTERAQAAMNELVKLGVEASRMEAEGYGDEHPLASNDTPEGRAQNRRIDLRVTSK